MKTADLSNERGEKVFLAILMNQNHQESSSTFEYNTSDNNDAPPIGGAGATHNSVLDTANHAEEWNEPVQPEPAPPGK